MNVHERELLRQLKQGPLPMNLRHQAGIEAAKILKGLGYIDATVHDPKAKGAPNVHAMGTPAMVIVSGVTSLGQAVAER
jgi:hypothetical protein